MTLDPARAAEMGRLGQAVRWAKHVDPEARRAQTQAARDAIAAKYLDRAREMGDAPPEQLEERARQLRRADLAAMRLRGLTARRRRRAA